MGWVCWGLHIIDAKITASPNKQNKTNKQQKSKVTEKEA